MKTPVKVRSAVAVLVAAAGLAALVSPATAEEPAPT